MVGVLEELHYMSRLEAERDAKRKKKPKMTETTKQTDRRRAWVICNRTFAFPNEHWDPSLNSDQAEALSHAQAIAASDKEAGLLLVSEDQLEQWTGNCWPCRGTGEFSDGSQECPKCKGTGSPLTASEAGEA